MKTFDNIIKLYQEQYGPEEAYNVLDNDMGYILNDCMPMYHHVSSFLANNVDVCEYLSVQEHIAKDHVHRLWDMLPNTQRELIVNQLI